MDKILIDELTEEFRQKICEIVNVWLEIGIANEKFITRSNTLKQHVNALLDGMIKEENRHKYEVEKSIESLTNEISKLCSDLKMECDFEFEESLVKKESSLLNKHDELSEMKRKRIEKFHYLLDLEADLCGRLFEYRLDLDRNLIPTESQLITLEKQIDQLERLKKNRTRTLLSKRSDIVRYYSILYEQPSTDAFIHHICHDENATDVPLSMDCLSQCDRLIDRLKAEYDTHVDECNRIRSRCARLHSLLFPQADELTTAESQKYGHEVLKSLKVDVAHLETLRTQKMGEFIKNYQMSIRDKLQRSFSAHLVETSDVYRWLLNTDDANEDLLSRLEAESDKWSAIELQLEPLRQLMETWETLFHKLLEINLNLKNPVILKNRGGILLKVEKERNAVKKDLPKCESKIKEILVGLDGQSTVGVSGCDLRIGDVRLEDYLAAMWDQVEGEKENERKERKLKPVVANSKLNTSRNQITAKKPLQAVTQQKVGVVNKGWKPAEFKKPEIIKNLSKIPLKANPLSPITVHKSFQKSNPLIHTNLDRRFSKSHGSLMTTKMTKSELTGSSGNLYALFCVC